MRHASLTTLFLFAAACDLPSGLEQDCDDPEVASDTDLVESSVSVLQDQAALETEAGAALIGAEPTGESPRFAASDDIRVYASRVSTSSASDAFVLVPDGAETLLFGGEKVEIGDGDVMEVIYTDSGDIDLDIYDSKGVIREELSASVDSASAIAVGHGIDYIAVVEMYGDIIMGSVPLDDFYD